MKPMGLASLFIMLAFNLVLVTDGTKASQWDSQFCSRDSSFYPIAYEEISGYNCKVSKSFQVDDAFLPTNQISGNSSHDQETINKVTKCEAHGWWKNVTCYLSFNLEKSKKVCFKIDNAFYPNWSRADDCQGNKCVWNSYHPYHADTVKLYGFLVKIQNRGTLCKAWSNDTISVDASKILQLEPVNGVQYEVNNTAISFKWKHHRPYYKILYRIRIQSQWEPETMNTFFTCSTDFIHNYLIPNTEYSFVIDSLPIQRTNFTYRLDTPVGYWSESICLAVQTEEDVPGAAPDFSPGSYYASNGTDRVLTMFSKAVPDRLQHGNIKETELCYQTIDPSCEFVEGMWETNKTCVYCKVTKMSNCVNQQFIIPANETIVLTMNARTNMGYNKNLNLKQMFIFQEDDFADARETLRDFHVTSENVTGVNFNWTMVDECIGYTLYWCPRGALVGHCREDRELEWVHINQCNVSHAFVNLLEPYEEYSFAISAEFNMCNGTVSTGMVFYSGRDCIYSANKEVIPPKNIAIGVDHSNDIVVQWDNPSCTESGFIHHYNVLYCSKGQCNLHDYTAGNFTLEPSASLHQSHHIRNLELDTLYKVLIQSCSVASCSSFTSSQYFDLKSSAFAKYKTVIIAVGVICAVVSIFGGIFVLRILARKVKVFLGGVPIVLPENNSENMHFITETDRGQLGMDKDNQNSCQQYSMQQELLLKESSL